MEGKIVILSVFIMTLVTAQIQVESVKIRCPTPLSVKCFGLCHIWSPPEFCAVRCGCKIVDGTPNYSNDILENSVQEDVVNEYCKVGCVSFVCSGLTTLQISEKNEIVNGAVAQCTKTCSTLCAKGSKTALKTA